MTLRGASTGHRSRCVLFLLQVREQMVQRIGRLTSAVAALVGFSALVSEASAEDVLRLAVAQRAAWDSAAPQLGQSAGIFKKHGIALDLIYVEDDGETELPVTSGK